MKTLKILIGTALIIAGFKAFYLPYFTFIFQISSFYDWGNVDLYEKTFGVLMLFAFTGFSAIPSFFLLYSGAWFLKNSGDRSRFVPPLFCFRK